MNLAGASAHGRIDVQFPFSPAFHTDLVEQTSHIWTDRWSTEAAPAYMDSNGVDAGILSVSTPSVDFLRAAASVTLARRLNEAGMGGVRMTPRGPRST